MPQASGPYAPVINPADFSTIVDNRYFPLTPGTSWLYQTVDASERVEVQVTDETKTVMGARCVVVRSREYEGARLLEETADWYAQDRQGNVWYFGEDTKAHKSGGVSAAGSWEAGRDGALPGVIMLALPDVGREYRQEYYKGHAEDMGQVLRLGETVNVPFGTFDNVLVIKDWTPLEHGDVAEKYFAPGIGLVLEVEENQRVQLVRMSHASRR